MVADTEGRWSKLWIPKDVLWLCITKPGYARVDAKLAPADREHVVVLEEGRWSVSGRVVDRDTKAPVTKFRVTEGRSGGGSDNVIYWHQSRPVANVKGEYLATWEQLDERRAVRIGADGYYALVPKVCFGTRAEK